MKQIKLSAKGIEKLTAFVKESRGSVVENSTAIEGLEYTKTYTQDLVQINAKRAELAKNLKNGKKVVNNTENKFNITRGILDAPRIGFDETRQAYVDMIKNNKNELRELCNEYFTNENFTNEMFVNKYAKFLCEKMNMPLYPELKSIIDDKIAGGFCGTANTIVYNLYGIKRLSHLMATVNHEMHHFLQQKEIFATMTIEEFSVLKAKAKFVGDHFTTAEDKAKAIAEETKVYIEDFKSAGWEEVIRNYPKNTNPNSPYYKRAQELLKAELKYVNGEVNPTEYYKNLLEKEAHEVGFFSELEIEHTILNQITQQEKETAISIYNILRHEGSSTKIELFNRINGNPYNLIEIIREASYRGIREPYRIVELME